MGATSEPRVPWFLWPFYAIWRLLTLILRATGRLACGLLGVVFIAAGVVVTLTVVGAPIGIPLAVLGVLLMVRALF